MLFKDLLVVMLLWFCKDVFCYEMFLLGDVVMDIIEVLDFLREMVNIVLSVDLFVII